MKQVSIEKLVRPIIKEIIPYRSARDEFEDFDAEKIFLDANENPFENGFGSLVQGALESSNVNVVQELVDMIETQRAYEVNSKAISGVDDMLRFISQNL